MNRLDQKGWRSVASPSGLAMAGLLGFLCVGEMTDWKIISRRSSKSKSSVRFGVVDRVPAKVSVEPDPAQRDRLSEVADRRNGHEPQQNQREID